MDTILELLDGMNETLWLLEDAVVANAPPVNVNVAGMLRRPVVESRAPVMHLPGHLEDAWMALHAFYAQPGMKWPSSFQVRDHLIARGKEKRLLLRG